jgi:hypothetical protein
MPTPTTPGVPVELVRALIAAEREKDDAGDANQYTTASMSYREARAAVEAAIKEIEG